MNIKFKVNETIYHLGSDKYQIILSKINTVKSGKNKGGDNKLLIGYFKTPFQALKSVLNNEIYSSECKSFMELEKRYKTTLNTLDEITKNYSLK